MYVPKFSTRYLIFWGSCNVKKSVGKVGIEQVLHALKINFSSEEFQASNCSVALKMSHALKGMF